MDRLQKVIARAGIASRRKAEELITAGKVKVNGEVVTELGTKVGKKDSVIVNGMEIQAEEKEYYVINKPKGVLSSVTDDRGRDCVVDLIRTNARIYPVGRLDFDTTGVIILTNDGDFANHLMHPSHEIEKEYVATVRGIFTKQHKKILESGVFLDGKKTSNSLVNLVGVNKEKEISKVQLIIHEGRYHQVKRMFQAIDMHVLDLKRTRYGVVSDIGLQIGESRRLKIHERKLLIESVR